MEVLISARGNAAQIRSIQSSAIPSVHSIVTSFPAKLQRALHGLQHYAKTSDPNKEDEASKINATRRASNTYLVQRTESVLEPAEAGHKGPSS